MHDASEFYEPWETTLGSYAEARAFIDRSDSRWSKPKNVFAWRGCVDASWPFHSSLYRRLLWATEPQVPKEAVLLRRERDILDQAQRWGLHSGERGRLSTMEQLATLQHFGAPTRLLDITFNPLIALWFAVADDPNHNLADGRLFVVDVTKRLINESPKMRGWPSAVVALPWDHERSTHPLIDSKEWRSSAWAWRPPRFLGRIANQHGGFLFGGVPATTAPSGKPQFRIPKGTTADQGFWKIDEVRKSTSLAIRFHKVDARAGGVSGTGQAAYTVRIASTAKKEIRDVLRNRYELDFPTIFGDYPGFALHGTPNLPSEAP